MSDLHERIKSLPPDKQAQLLRKLRQAAPRAPQPSIPPVPRDQASFPVSFAQQRFWFLHELQPGAGSYNVPMVAWLDGLLDAGALQRSFQALVERHESLRTTFRAEEGQPVQLIAPGAEVAFVGVDLEGLPVAQREAEARRRAEEEARKPFDLAQGPLLRVTLLRLEARRHLLVAVMHHIVSDGWSMGLLLREMAVCYEALSHGRPPPALPALPIQYADYAAWQREWLRGEVLEAQLRYWREQLKDAPPVLELPTDHPRPAMQSGRGASQPVQLPRELVDRLAALCRQSDATLFMGLLAVFQLLLSRYSGQLDVSVGFPIAGRSRSEVEGLIGLFVNTLVLRTRLSGEPTFRELLGRVKEVTLGAYAHQEVPFDALVQALSPERSLSHSPLFQVMLVLQNAQAVAVAASPGAPGSSPGLSLRTVPLDIGAERFDLTLNVTESEQGLVGVMTYSTDLFEAATVSRMVGHLRVLLEGAVAEPDRPCFALPLTDEAERNRLLVEWNDTRADFPREARVHELFEAQVARTPDAVAVVWGGERLTYAALNRRANQLAHHLRARGVGPEAQVGLYVERSPELVVGLLGILKAGAAYVPVDPSYPVERIAFMLEDSRIALLVTQERLAARLSPMAAQRVLLDVDAERLAREPAEDPPRAGSADDLAYVIYTSGSTGRPKGVLVEHRGVVNYLAWCARTYPVAEGEGAPVHSSLAFDLTVTSLLLPLVTGRPVVLVPEHDGAEGLGKALRAGRDFSLVKLTPSHLQLLAQQLSPAEAGGRTRAFVIGGEALVAESLAFWRTHAPQTRLINEYGPTETVVGCCVHEVSAEDAAEGAVAIGRPIANVALHVLDRRLQLVPVGVPGELYIGGVAVARGYQRRPELTAERFVPDPFSAEPGARLYRTGDRVRRRADGRLEYLGRLDDQVKVRGFRIELGEIESALAAHPQVKEAIVAVREDAPGDKRLVAYVVPRGEPASPSALRAHLQGSLPEYMVPSAFAVLEALPLSPNGKVDRKALPVPEARSEAKVALAPRTPTEELLAGLWAEVLRVAKVGVRDDFFALGGHSLLASQLVARVRATLGIELPLRALFECRTVEELARRVDDTALVKDAPRMPRPERLEHSGPPPLSFAQQRLWFLQQLDPDSPAYNMPTALQLEGPLDVAALERGLAELMRRHESLRTTVRVEGGEPVQHISPPSPLPLPKVDLTGLPPGTREEEARRLAMEEAQRPFDLVRGPLLRARLLQLEDQRHVLLVNMHHLVSDGWSIGVLSRELAALYEAFRQGKPSPLPELPVQYADYAVWQRRWLTGPVLEQQLSYWRGQLAGAPDALELPADRPRPPMQTFRGAQQPMRVPRPLVEALEGLCKKEGVTPFMLVLAAFQVLLSRWSGQDDISVGSPVAGRRYAELEGLVGCFANTLVLRSRLAGNPSFRALLAQVREVALGAYAHQDIPFEKLVDELQPARDPSRSPLFQVMLNFQSGSPAAGTADASPSTLETEGRTAKFELTLMLAPSADGWSGGLEYNTDLFDRGTAERMAGHLRMLLEGIAARPDARIGELPLMTDEEQRRVLREWNATRADFPASASIPQLFEAQVARTPEAIALSFEGERLSYRELDARAARLAGALRSLGVGPEARVGICLERSHELVIGLLAILKAGGAYVPLDPSYPPERLSFMLQDSGAQLLLTRAALASRVTAPGVQGVMLEEVERREAPETPPQAPELRADNLAYVLYTSGSTGRPKGVMVPHRTVSNFFSAMDARVSRPSSGGVWLAVTSASFDISVLELLWTLARGFEVVVQPEIASSSWLAPQVERYRVTHLQCTPSLAQALLLDPASANALRSLHQLLVGGEALPAELARRLLERLPPGGLLNMYGPTETTIWSSSHPVRGGEVAGAIPLGTPIANTALYVLDARQQPVPIGVPGELYIGGEGVVRGYLGRPELTAERFVPDPFAGSPGARLYRTGDRARWRPDGTVEFLGRMDFQVKVRGHRIELGEIEAQLDRHPSVSRSVVVVREDSPGERRLVAYVVPAGGASPDPDALRAWLRERLPEPMVPFSWVVMPALPLTPNGKVDRKALPAPTRQQGTRPMVPPRTSAEQALAPIWSELLGAERISVHDNFFALGGDSLLGLRMVTLAAQAGLSLQLRQLFQHQTLEALAAAAGTGGAHSEPGASVAARASTQDEEIPLTPPQHWYVRNFDVENDVWALNLIWEVPLPLDLELLRASVAFLIQHHDVLRLRLQRTEGGWVQRVLASASVPVEAVELAGLGPEEQQQTAMGVVARLQSSLNISRGPTLRFALCRLGSAAPDRLILSIHHSIYDAYSLPLLLGDLVATYQQLAAGEAPRPPPVSATYRELGRAIAAYGQSEAMQQARAFWLDEARLRSVPPLPVDFEGGQHTNFNTHSLSVPLPPELGQAMLAYMQSHEDVQLNDLLLYGLARAYARWSGGQPLRVDVEHNGRTGQVPGVDLTRTVGAATLKFPVRFDVRSEASPQAAFAEVRRTLRGTLEHALGFGFLRFCSDEATRQRIEAIGSPQVFFNNRRLPVGRTEEEGQGPGKIERVVLPRADGKPSLYTYDLMVECDGAGTALVLSFIHSRAIHREETIRALAEELLAQIAALTGSA